MRVILLLCFVISPMSAFGHSSIPLEGRVLHAVARGIQLYELNHNGARPSTWGQLGQILDLETTSAPLRRVKGYGIDDRYSILAEPVPLPSPYNGEVLVIGTHDLVEGPTEESQVYRYVVLALSGGSYQAIKIEKKSLIPAFNEVGSEFFQTTVAGNLENTGAIPHVASESISAAHAEDGHTHPAIRAGEEDSSGSSSTAQHSNNPYWLLLSVFGILLFAILAMKCRGKL